MRATRFLLILAATLLSLTACTARTGTEGRFSLITHEELQEQGQYSNLYAVIEVLRPRWLRPQGGPDTFEGEPGQVQVHMDGNWMGDVDVLRNLSPAGVTSIRWLKPLEASARYGLDHSHGAIIISTRVVH
ncbi:MAG: hypothetical protein R3314_00590 [Longimicrobiales bacterium]|nr:hypothetical protein [Longimicrobiales bacterium]